MPKPNLTLKHIKKSNLSTGFNLLELAIIITISSIITMLSLEMGNYFVAIHKWQDTQKSFIAAQEALTKYFAKHKTLPCPESFANSLAQPASCDSITSCPNAKAINNIYIGYLPKNLLGLHHNLDGWNNKIIYGVDRNFMCFKDAEFHHNAASITIKNIAGNVISKHAIYALLSAGKNGSYEMQPAQMNDVFYYKFLENKTKLSHDDYDDIVKFQTKQQLIVSAKLYTPFLNQGKIYSYLSDSACYCTNFTLNQDINSLTQKFCVQ